MNTPQSLLVDVLRHHHCGDSMFSTAATAEEFVNNGATLGPSELDAVAAAWALGCGQEVKFNALGEQYLDQWVGAKHRAEANHRLQWDGCRPYKLRSIKLHQLREIYSSHQLWIDTKSRNKYTGAMATRSMHSIVAQIIKPRTLIQKCSYSDLLPPQECDVFVSHNWAGVHNMCLPTPLTHLRMACDRSFLILSRSWRNTHSQRYERSLGTRHMSKTSHFGCAVLP